jgi:hypothetical protein
MLRAAIVQAVDEKANDPRTMKAVDDILAVTDTAAWHYAAMLWNWSNNLSASGECRFTAESNATFLYSHFMGLPDAALSILTGKGRLQWLQGMTW